MIEYTLKECVFHFNKKHLEDNTVPMWSLKFKGKTMYVDHIDSTAHWTTKETPDSTHTKGSIKFKNVSLKIDDNNCAIIKQLSTNDMSLLKAKVDDYVRILFTGKTKTAEFLKTHAIKHTRIKKVLGRCGSTYYACDLKDKDSLVMLQLGLLGGSFRVLQENEPQYKAYDSLDPTPMIDDDFDGIDDGEG
jgi:hypothetical protein